MINVKRIRLKEIAILVFGILSSLFFSGSSHLFVIGIIIWINVFIYLRRNKIYLFIFMLCTPWLFIPTKCFIKGCNNYLNGNALIFNNKTFPADYRIDRETRVPVPFQGCMRPMYYGLMTIGNDTGVKFCTSIFGYQTNAYTGIYPDSDSVKSLISNYDTIRVKRKNGKYRFESIENKLIAEFPLQTFNQYEYFDFGTHPDSILKGKVIDEKCLIFMPFDYDNTCHRMPIHLVAIKEEKLLCIYR